MEQNSFQIVVLLENVLQVFKRDLKLISLPTDNSARYCSLRISVDASIRMSIFIIYMLEYLLFIEILV